MTQPHQVHPGYADPNWVGKFMFECWGFEAPKFGCQQTVEIPRSELFTVDALTLGDSRSAIGFFCPACHELNVVNDGGCFKNLPTQQEWLDQHRPAPQGFIIKLDHGGYYCTFGRPAGWTHSTKVESADVFTDRMSARKVIDTVPNVKNYHPEIILRPAKPEFVIEVRPGEYFITDYDTVYSSVLGTASATTFPDRETAQAMINSGNMPFNCRSPVIRLKPEAS